MPRNMEPDDLYPPAVDGKCNAKIGATETRPRRRCKKTTGSGTDHPGFGSCKWHGGSTPSQKQIGALAMYEAEFARQTRFGEIIPIDPILGLGTEIGRTNGMVAYLQEEIQKAADPDTGDVRLFEADAFGNQRPTQLILLWRAERNHFVKVCKMALDAGIEQQALDFVTAYQSRILDLIESLLAELGHNPNDPEVDALVTRHLALVTAKGAAG